VPRCRPRSSLPAKVLAWLAARLTPPRRARDRVAPGRCRWRSAWTRSPQCCWTAVVPACRPGGRDLQDGGRRRPGPAAWSAGRSRVVPAWWGLHQQPRRAWRAPCGDGRGRRGRVRGRAGDPGATAPRVGQPEAPVPRACRAAHAGPHRRRGRRYFGNPTLKTLASRNPARRSRSTCALACCTVGN
jgi:hypothetical protein